MESLLALWPGVKYSRTAYSEAERSVGLVRRSGVKSRGTGRIIRSWNVSMMGPLRMLRQMVKELFLEKTLTKESIRV